MKARCQQGFTLVEVVVALIILGISLGAVFQVLSVSRRISEKADETLTAVRLAQNLLSDPALVNSVMQGSTITHPVEGESGWRYSFSAVPLEIALSTNRDVFQVPAMVELDLCLYHATDLREKAFCIRQWYRQ